MTAWASRLSRWASELDFSRARWSGNPALMEAYRETGCPRDRTIAAQQLSREQTCGLKEPEGVACPLRSCILLFHTAVGPEEQEPLLAQSGPLGREA